MGMGLAGLGTASGAAQGLQEILAQRLRERQMALQEQAQREEMSYKNRSLDADIAAGNETRTQNDLYRQAVLALQGQNAAQNSDYQQGRMVDSAARNTAYGQELNVPTAVKFKAYDQPVSGPSDEMLNSPLANEQMPPYRFEGNKPQLKLKSPEEVGQELDITEQKARINARYRPAPQGGAGGVGSGLTPGGLDVAATQYAQTGQMPPLGMGSSSMRKDIINRAAELFPGVNIGGEAGKYRANVGSLSQMTKRYNAVKAYAEQAKLSLQNAARLSGTVPRSGSPIANKYRNWANKTLKGSAPLSEFEVFVFTAARDYARVTSGGAESVAQMTDAATEAADVLLNSAQTPEAFAASLKAMQADMDNVTSTIRDQIVNLKTDVGTAPGQAEPTPAPSGGKSVTSAQIQAVAKKNGTTVEQETARAQAEGYVIR